jgi:hypothetical protein
MALPSRAIVRVVVVGGLILVWAAMPPTVSAPLTAPLLAQTQVRLAVCPIAGWGWADQNRFRVEALQVFRDGFVVRYAAACDDIATPPPLVDGFRVVRRAGLGWRDLGGEDLLFYDAGCVSLPGTGQLACCNISAGENDEYVAVYGRVLSTNIATVQVIFDNGDVGSAHIIRDKFVVASPHGPDQVTAGRMRLLNDGGQVLDEIELDLGNDARAAGTTGCLP